MTRHRHRAPRAVLGICLLVATLMVATAAWSPVAAEATRSVTFIIQTPDGRPVEGMKASWLVLGGSAGSATSKPTDSEGKVSWNSVPMTEILFHGVGSGVVADGPNARYIQRLVVVPESGDVVVSTGKVPDIRQVTVKVQMPDGTPVADNVWVYPGHGFERSDGKSYHLGASRLDDVVRNMWYACPSWDPWCDPTTSGFGKVTVNEYGIAKIWRFVEPQIREGSLEAPHCYHASYNDGDLRQGANAACTSDDTVTITLPYMPVVAPVEPPLESYLPTEEVEVSVQAVDGNDAPIAGQSVQAQQVSTSDASVAPSAACSAKFRGTTGKAGYTTLRICANKTKKWRVNGPSIVASRPFPVLIRQKGSPGGLRDVTVVKPAPGKVVLRWRAPKWQGWSAIRKYQVRWSTDGGYTWSRWQGTGLTRRYARMFTQGERYIFQLRAVNKRGGGVVKVKRIRA